MLIEVLASAVILLIVSSGIFALVQATGHSTGEDRHRSEAYAISQEDQARLRTMRLSDLNGFNQTRSIVLNGSEFKVHSTGTFINDLTATNSCGNTESSSADYVRITSEVTWPKMQTKKPATIESIISPSKVLSLDPNNGTLSVTARNALNAPLSALKLVGTGIEGTIGSFTGETTEAGCAMFANLPSGKYSMLPSGVNLIDKDGKPPAASTVSVVRGGTYPAVVEYDHPGTLAVSFETTIGGKSVPAKGDSIFVINTGMTQARIFTTTNLVRSEKVEAASLFPFPGPYSVYAGYCSVNNPNPTGEATSPGAAGLVAVTVPSGGTATAKVKVPALEVTVKNGATAIKGAKVTITDRECREAKNNLFKRTYSTNSEGKQATSEVFEPGLPWGSYEVCASALIGSTIKKKKVSPVAVKNLTTPTLTSIDLSTATETGECT